MSTFGKSKIEGKLNGRIALVTGSSYGIGRGIALELAKAGASVIVTGRREAQIQKTVDAILEMGGDAIGRRMDVSVKSEIDAFFKDVVEPVGLDIFCNNAGITVVRDFIDNTEEDIESICRTNLLGAVYCIQNAARIMRKQGRGGNIVVITSCNAMAPLPTQSFYSATKCALEGLVRGIAWELRNDKIRVNAVAPGAVESGLTEGVPQECIDEVCKDIPVPRIGQPEDIGKAVVYITSDDASYVNGTSLVVDGGLILRAG